MDAPKRIWVDLDLNTMGYVTDHLKTTHTDVVYIIESDHDAEVAGLKAQIERLRKAVVELAIPLEALRMTGGTVLTDEIVRATDIARAAINGDDNG